jgi:hypothetical protein
LDLTEVFTAVLNHSGAESSTCKWSRFQSGGLSFCIMN